MAIIFEVNRVMPTANKVGAELVVKDDVSGDEYFRHTYWDNYSPEIGATAQNKENIQKAMQADINMQLKLRNFYGSAEYAAALADIQSNLTL